MFQGRTGNAKKSLYLFLSSLLGMLLFLAVHQIATFFFLVWAALRGRLVAPDSYLLFLVLDYFSLIIALMLGSWYGIWLGMHWYGKVYEQGSYPGVVSHWWGSRKAGFNQADNFVTKVKVTKQALQEGVKDFEQLTEEFPPAFIAEKIRKKASAAKRNGKKSGNRG